MSFSTAILTKVDNKFHGEVTCKECGSKLKRPGWDGAQHPVGIAVDFISLLDPTWETSVDIVDEKTFKVLITKRILEL